MKKTIFSIATVTAITGVASGNISASAYGDAGDSNSSDNAPQEITASASNYENYSYSYDEDGYTYWYGDDGSGESQTQESSNQQTSEEPAASAADVNTTQQVPEEPKAPAAPQAQESTVTDSNAASAAQSLAQGKSYSYGANTSTLVDCSALTQQFMKEHKGQDIPRTVSGQKAAGTQTSSPQPGDLVFFNNSTHVGIYVGNGQMVDALNASEPVGERSVSYVSGSVDGYYTY